MATKNSALGGAGITGTGISRRRLLAAGGIAAVAGPILAACSSSSSSTAATSASSTGTPSLGELSYQLSWVKNVEFAGSYIADTKGYYKAQGFSSVNLIAGGSSSTGAETVVSAGKALVGVSSPDITSAAIVKGAPIKIIGAQYQKNPFAIMSLAKTPIATPQDMYGKKIGVQVANA